LAWAPIVPEATAARELADAAAMNCRLVKSLLSIVLTLQFGVFSEHDIRLKVPL
jgi:hypothetical protein